MLTALLIFILSLLPQPPEPATTYTMTLLPGPQIRVDLLAAGGVEGVTELELQPNWGGVDNDGGDVTLLAVKDSHGKALEVEHPTATRWTVKHAPAERLSASYIIPARPLPPSTRGNDYRTHLDSDLFQMIGELGLLLPQHLDNPTPRPFVITFNGFDREGWKVASSFGKGQGPFAITRSGQDVRHGLIFAGKVRTLTRSVGGNTVGFAIVGDDWGFDDDAFADMTTRIIAAERNFWNDHTDPWFLVTLTPNGTKAGNGSFSIGGTGLTDAFALYCNTGLSLDAGSPHAVQIKRLLAHEYFHTWNGGKIKSAGEDGAGYWFSEGFTDFYARRMLHRAGMASDSEYLGHLNEMLGQAAANPVRNAPASKIQDEFWTSQDVQKLPYQRGDQIALALDEKIRSASQGRRSLDDFMLALLEKSRAGEPYSTEFVLKLIESQTDAEFAASIRGAVVDGADVPLPATLTVPAAKLTKGTSRSFDAGFDIDATRKTKVLTGVRPGTAAHQAGLREGQKMKGLSISSGTPDAPPFAKVTIDEGGASKVIAYDPLTAPMAVPQYTPAK